MSTALGSDMERRAPLPFPQDSPWSCKVAWNTCVFFPSSLDYLFRCFGQLLRSCLTSVWSAQASTICPSKRSARLKSECSAWLRTHCLSIKVQFPAHFLEEIIPIPVVHRGDSVPGFEHRIRDQESWLFLLYFPSLPAKNSQAQGTVYLACWLGSF